MLQRWIWRRLGAMPALLGMLLSGCACELPSFSQPVEPARIPSLPAQARQPQTLTNCSPSCSAALTTEREAWLRILTPPGRQGRPASEATMR